MNSKLVPVSDPNEKSESQRVVDYLNHVPKVGVWLADYAKAQPHSRLGLDDSKIPIIPVSQYAYAQIITAISCLESLKRMIYRENGDEYSLELPLYGDFALVRNAIDCLAVALWLLEPINSKLRIKRRIILHRDENLKEKLWKLSVSKFSKPETRQLDNKLTKYATEAGLNGWDPLGKNAKLIPTTKMLRHIEVWHKDANISWLATWQFASGHAHGKLWALAISHNFELLEGTEHEHGGTFFITGNFSWLAVMLKETLDLLEVTARKYAAMAKD